MSKFGGIFARKPNAYDLLAHPSPTTLETPLPHNPLTNDDDTANGGGLPTENPLEVDEELFSSLGAQIGNDNETLRNLLLDANAKIGELDAIKAAVARLTDPVTKALRAFEAEKAEKINLQTVLNNTRTAYGKLRNEVAELEKKAQASDKECAALRQDLAASQNLLRAAEATKAEIAIDVGARRAQIADLEGRLAQQTTESNSQRDENRRLGDKLTTVNKRVITLESDINAARQRLLMADDEKRALQTTLDRMNTDASRMARKLTETEAGLAAAQGRLRHVENNFAEVNNERARLVSAVDEANERHDHELTSQRMRFEALQSRAATTDRLLGEARDHLLARAEEIRDFDRRLSDALTERDNFQARLSDMEAERIRREAEMKDMDQARATLMERSAALTRAFVGKEAALARADDATAALTAEIEALTAAKASDKELAERAIEELGAALRREKLDRAVVEGALEAARKDFARVMREVMSLQRQQQASEEPDELDAANAA